MARPVPSLGPIARKPRRLTAFALSILGHSLVFGGVVVYAIGAPGELPEPVGVVILEPLPEVSAPPPPPAAPPPGVRSQTRVKPPQPASDDKLVAPFAEPTTLPQPEAPEFASFGDCTENCVIGGLVGSAGIGSGIVGGLDKTVTANAAPQRISEVQGPDAVKQWLYTPTLLNGVPRPVVMNVTVNFALQRQ